MASEETHEGDDIESADEDVDPSSPTPHATRRDSVGRPSVDMEEHQLQEIVRVGENKYPQKLCTLCEAYKKRKDTGYICNISMYSPPA
jgi:hypothetical protein